MPKKKALAAAEEAVPAPAPEAEKAAEAVEAAAAPKPVKKTTRKKTAPAEAEARSAAAEPKPAKKIVKKSTKAVKAAEEAPAQEAVPAPAAAEAAVAQAPIDATAAEDFVPETAVESLPEPRRSVAFIGSECYPFVKTGGLGDVMYALPRALARQNCDVKVILPRYKCIPWKYQEKMVYRGEFMMDLCSDGRSFYVGIME